MQNVALMMGTIQIYWHGVIMAAAIAVSIVVSFIFSFLYKDKQANHLLNCILLSLPLALIGSRLIYWTCNVEEYETLSDYFHFSRGGYALYGAILGILASALLLRKLSSGFNAGAVLDCMAVGGALGIAIGRISSYYSGDNIGGALNNKSLQFFPVAVYNAQRNEWLLATFVFEAVFGFIIFIVLSVIFAKNSNEKKSMRGRHGDIALLFLLMHGCSQGLFDSMHIDTLYVMGNSFVRLQQILGAVSFTVVTVIFALRSKKVNGFRLYQAVSVLIALAAVGLALWMELDRISSHNFIRNYSVIFSSMLGAAINGIVIYRTTLSNKTQAES